MEEEIWLDVPGYDGLYKVSNAGRVMSYSKNKSGVLMKPSYCGYEGKKYLRLRLKRKAYPVHRIVALAFLPNPENKLQVNHINGIKDDNRSVNLEWSTPSENIIHSIQTGLKKVFASGFSNGNTKISDEDVKDIVSGKYNYNKAKEILGISEVHYYRIKKSGGRIKSKRKTL